MCRTYCERSSLQSLTQDFRNDLLMLVQKWLPHILKMCCLGRCLFATAILAAVTTATAAEEDDPHMPNKALMQAWCQACIAIHGDVASRIGMLVSMSVNADIAHR